MARLRQPLGEKRTVQLDIKVVRHLSIYRRSNGYTSARELKFNKNESSRINTMHCGCSKLNSIDVYLRGAEFPEADSSKSAKTNFPRREIVPTHEMDTSAVACLLNWTLKIPTKSRLIIVRNADSSFFPRPRRRSDK